MLNRQQPESLFLKLVMMVPVISQKMMETYRVGLKGCFITLSLFLLAETLSGKTKKEIEPLSDTVSILFQLKKAVSLKSNKEYDSAIKILDSILVANDSEFPDNRVLSFIFNVLANIYSDRGEIVKSINYYNQAIHLARDERDHVLMARYLNNVGIAYSDLNFYEDALESFFEAIAILEMHPVDKLSANVYNSIGLLQHKNKNYEQAIYYHHQALLFREKTEDQIGVAGSYNNLGLAYLDTHQLDSARHYLHKAFEIKTQLNDLALLSTTLINLAELHVKENDFDNAHAHLSQALDYSRSIKMPSLTIEALLGFSKFYITRNHFTKAETSLQEATKLAHELKDQSLIFQVYQQYQKLYEKWGNYEKAYLYSQKYHALKDSLINEERIRVAEWNKELEKREVEKEKVIAEQRASLAIEENRRQKVWILALSAIALIFIMLGSIIWANRRKIRQQNVELLKKNRIIEIQKADIRHQTKNGLLRVRNILKLLKRELNDERSAIELEKAENMILALTALEDYLFDQPENREVEMCKFLSMLKEKLMTAHGMEEKINIDVESDEVTLHLNVAIPIALIISETVTNSIKHAFENVDFPLIKLLFKKTKENYRLVIRDNGQGLQHNGSPGGGWGSEIVKSYVKQLNGSINVRHEGGLINEFLFPLQ